MKSDEQMSLINMSADSASSYPVASTEIDTNETVLTWSHVFVECRRKSTYCDWFQETKSEDPRLLLDNLSGIARPGKVLAIMGTSGVGKTTLLKVLSGQNDAQTTVTRGDVMLNDRVTTRTERLNGSVIGYVEQNELFVETMSLEEHLIFQAMLRMPRSMNDHDRRAFIEKTLALLSLDRSTKTVISQLSGGERKRLSFAGVLLTDPHVVLLDEPTSGLDLYLARGLMDLIRKMAVEMRRTIVVVLHQPTSDMFALLDSLCLIVHGGRQAFFGDVNEAPVFFSTECGISASSLDSYIELLAAPPEEAKQTLNQGTMVADRFAQSKYARALNDIVNHVDGKIDENKNNDQIVYQSGFLRQLKWLMWRSLMSGGRDPVRTTNIIIRSFLPAILFGLIYFNLQHSIYYEKNVDALCLAVLSLTMHTCIFVVLGTLPADIHLFIKENSRSMYGTLVYYIATVLRDLPIFIIMPFITSTIVYLFSGINDQFFSFLAFVGTVVLTSNTGAALASFLSSFSNTIQSAITTVIPVIQLFLIFSGFFVSLRHISVVFRIIEYLSPLQYGFSNLYQLQWDSNLYSQSPYCRRQNYNNYNNTGGSSTMQSPDPFCFRVEKDQQIALRTHRIGFNTLMLIVLATVYHTLAFIIIWYRAHANRLADRRLTRRRQQKKQILE